MALIEGLAFVAMVALCTLRYYIDFPKYWRMVQTVYEELYRRYLIDPEEKKKLEARQ